MTRATILSWHSPSSWHRDWNDTGLRDIADKLRASGDLAALAELFLTGRPAVAELLLFIDQFEELFTLTAPEHHRRFIAMLAGLCSHPGCARS